MNSELPSALAAFRKFLVSEGFSEHDLLPKGGHMGSEKLVLHHGRLVFELGADRGFWYVSAGVAPTESLWDRAQKFDASVWATVLGKDGSRIKTKFPETDEAENEMLKQHAEEFQVLLGRMQDS